ncbi:uncharacterized protein LOC106664540 isoform X2 [Cimex lectularius]|nr:uncharacterized protein LOC106664540 isoform X2 [Cimex lectularius]
MSRESLVKDINDFKFSKCKILDLPIDGIRDNFVRRMMKGVVFSRVAPTPLASPRLVSFSAEALDEILDLDPVVVKSRDFVEFIAGNKLLPSSTPLAHRYGGHQFGTWAAQLGDGRAIVLGQYVNRKDQTWELQLKGSGMTPYSRDGDGRAVLRSSIREFLCSEAMHYLGIPTSRAGAIIVSADHVIRDLLYDGHPKLEPTSVVLRLAPSWFRIGSLEILAKYQENELLAELLNFIIKEYFPNIEDNEDKLLNFLKAVCRMTSDLVVAWQAVGFTHGVLNTDNISLMGITIDYGPFGFMEAYNPMYVPNHSDSTARYCYGRQITITIYNLTMLASAIAPLLNGTQMMKAARMVQEEENYMKTKLEEKFSQKLGLHKSSPELTTMLIKMLEETQADFVMTFRELSEYPIDKLKKPAASLWALQQLSRHASYPKFIEMYQKRLVELGITDTQRMEDMRRVNPCYTLRNWMAEEAIKAAHSGDFSQVDLLLRILKNPFTRQEEAEAKGYGAKPPSWSRTLCLSCSS